MRNSCLSYLKQGWFGLPLFFLGLGSLAFSQLETDSSSKNLTATDLASSIDSKILQGEQLMMNLRKEISLSFQNQISSIEQKISSKELSNEDKAILRAQFDNLVSRYKNREDSMNDSISQTEESVSSAKEIFGDIQSNFAGRLEEARPSLLAVSENLDGSLVELEALSTMSSGLVKDFSYEVSTLDSQVEASFAQRLSTPPNTTSKTVPFTSVGRKISSIIQAREALPKTLWHDWKKVELSEPKDFGSLASVSYQDEDGMIAKLRKELDDSKNFQSNSLLILLNSNLISAKLTARLFLCKPTSRSHS